MGNFHHLSTDPPTEVANRIWFLRPWSGSGHAWLGWGFRPGPWWGGTSLEAISKGRLWLIHWPCCSGDKSVRSLNSLSLENIPMVRDKDQELPPFLITFSRCENIFILPCQCQISQQLSSFEYTFLSPSTGQVHILCQLYPESNTKKITHISKPDIFSSCFCSRLVGNLLHMHNPVSCEYITLQVRISTSFSYNYLHCFKRSVRPNYLLPFQFSVDMFALGYKV